MGAFYLHDLYDDRIVLRFDDHAAMGSHSVFPWVLDEHDNPTDETPQCLHLANYQLADLLRWMGAEVKEPLYWRDPSMGEIPIPEKDRWGLHNIERSLPE